MGRQRRDAIRAAWMRDEAVARGEAVVCFVLSAQAPPPARDELQAERAAHGDLLLVDAPQPAELCCLLCLRTAPHHPARGP